jgi:hypothetical protein
MIEGVQEARKRLLSDFSGSGTVVAPFGYCTPALPVWR